MKNLQNAFLLGVLINNELDDNLMLFLTQAVKHPDLQCRSKFDIKLNADF